MKQIISEEWWVGCYRDDYFLHGGIGGDYNNGYMYGLQYEDYVLTTFDDGSQEVSEWRGESEARWFKTEEERESELASHKDYFLEKIE
tara:strand:+ start:273 stop:536 length:264 start_codon:yes stop_codon:yes gene_type:complete